MTSLEFYLLLILFGVIVGINFMIKVIRSLTLFHPPYFAPQSPGAAPDTSGSGGCFSTLIVVFILMLVLHSILKGKNWNLDKLNFLKKESTPADTYSYQNSAGNEYSALSPPESESEPVVLPPTSGTIIYDKAEHDGKEIWEAFELEEATDLDVSVQVQQPEAQSTGTIYIQIGAFSDYENALRARDTWVRKTPKSVFFSPLQNESGLHIRVIIGPFDTKQAAEQHQRRYHTGGNICDFSAEKILSAN